MPIADGSLDDIKGFCSTRYLLQQIVENGHVDFTSKMASVLYVPESLSGLELLENFRANDVPVAIVVDEYGTVQGLVSPRDVLEVNLSLSPARKLGLLSVTTALGFWMA